MSNRGQYSNYAYEHICNHFKYAKKLGYTDHDIGTIAASTKICCKKCLFRKRR